ncbi:MAG TPA: glycosyltransferase family 39 protein [bacterium]|nr:glycosyltransferase family 39 protein [bacterium]
MAPPILLGGILALGAVLAVFRSGVRSFWQDEATSVALAHLKWTSLAKVLWHGENNMALYYGVLHVWIGAVGDRESAVRMFSALAAVGAVGALYLLGARMFDRRVGFIAALLLSVNAYQIRYGQEARSYSLLVLLVTLSSWAYCRVLERPHRANMVLYCTASILAVYAHFFAALVLAAQWLSLVFVGRRAPALKAALASAGIICLLLVPLAVLAARNPHQVDWIPTPGPKAILFLFYALTGAAPTGAKALLLAYFGACAAAFGVGVKQFAAGRFSRATWTYGFLVMWLAVPLVVTLAISVVKPIFMMYYLIILLPPLVLLAAAGISKIPTTAGIAAAVVLIVAMALYEDARYLWSAADEDWRGAVAYAASQLQPDDGFVFDPTYVETPFVYYRPRLFAAGEPPPAAFPWDWSWERIADGQPRITRIPGEVVRTLPSRYSRIWLFSRRGETEPRLTAVLAAGCARGTQRDFGAVTLTLYGRCKP